MNLGLQSRHFHFILSIQAQSPVVGSVTGQGISRKLPGESKEIKGYCHAVEAYFHAFQTCLQHLNLLSMIILLPLGLKTLEYNYLIEAVSDCNSGQWISTLASLCDH